MTPSEVLQRHTAGELVEWKGFYKIERFGDRFLDVLNSVLCATVASAAPGRRRGGQTPRPKDFQVLAPAESPEPMAEADIRKVVARIQARAARRKAAKGKG